MTYARLREALPYGERLTSVHHFSRFENKRRIELGTYDTLKDAAAARREAETLLGFMTRPGTIKEKLKEQSQLALRDGDVHV